MTLVVAFSGPKSIWLLTDRRISYQGRKPKEDGRKLLELETTDGVALLGYAGLGSTVNGIEPSDWMGRVLRGRNLPLETSLGVLAEAARRQLPRHLELLPVPRAPVHNMIITAYLRGEPRLYSIDLTRPPDRNAYLFRFTRHVTNKATSLGQVAPRVAISGSGAVHLLSDRSWARELVNIVRAHDSGRISSQAVATYLARLNYRVHLATSNTDNSVGSRCIVVWRYRQGGGAHKLFSGTERESNSTMTRLPTIVNGMDINDIAEATMPYMTTYLEALLQGKSEEFDKDAINAKLARLSNEPDESID